MFPDINPCFGDLPVVDENTGLEYNCGIYGAECPPSSFCHQTAHFAKCCPIGMAFIFCMFFLLMQYSMMMSDVFFYVSYTQWGKNVFSLYTNIRIICKIIFE